uniref:Nitrite transporter n=1 Tax=Isochrysis zhanjiangensis TaxID=354139 RepID=A0A097NUA0_9EUKA|nr:nitrite transporter [Isochrysis zhanjiangensis]
MLLLVSLALHASLASGLLTTPGLSARALVGTSPTRLPHPRRAQPAMQLVLPAEGFEGAVSAGAKKAANSASKIFALGIMSGAHIGFGAFLMLSVGGCSPALAAANPGLQKIVLGAFGLPFGLMMTLVTGAELFTGNTALVTAALIEGKVKASELVKSWAASYAGNFVGSLALASLVFAGGTLATAASPVATATLKTSLSFKQAFVRGILCNWLVCMGVYMASMAKDLPGKMVAIWFPISAFVALSLEHSVANMFIIPLGIMSGAAVTWKAFLLKNLIPVTLGNIVGGAGAVAAAYSYAYGKLGK